MPPSHHSGPPSHLIGRSAAGLSSGRLLEGLDRLKAAGTGGAGGDSLPAEASATKKGGNKFLKSFGFGTSKQGEEANEFTHMRSGRQQLQRTVRGYIACYWSLKLCCIVPAVVNETLYILLFN